MRQEHGAQTHRLHRGLDDPNRVVIITEWATADQARAFVHSLALKGGFAISVLRLAGATNIAAANRDLLKIG